MVILRGLKTNAVNELNYTIDLSTIKDHLDCWTGISLLNLRCECEVCWRNHLSETHAVIGKCQKVVCVVCCHIKSTGLKMYDCYYGANCISQW